MKDLVCRANSEVIEQLRLLQVISTILTLKPHHFSLSVCEDLERERGFYMRVVTSSATNSTEGTTLHIRA